MDSFPAVRMIGDLTGGILGLAPLGPCPEAGPLLRGVRLESATRVSSCSVAAALRLKTSASGKKVCPDAGSSEQWTTSRVR